MKSLIYVFCLMMCIAAIAQASASVVYSKKDIQNIITLKANKHGVSASLAMAIAKVESDFNPKAHSHAGAKGVMQIMPATAMGEFGVSSYRLYDPTTNIDLGVRFIGHLIQKYDGRIDIALSHYNGGSRVRSKNGRLSVIPATRQYVNKVLNFEKKYRTLNQTSTKGYNIALDNFGSTAKSVYISSASTNTQSLPAQYSHSDSRVAALQALRVHNLTRSLANDFGRPQSSTQGITHNNNTRVLNSPTEFVNQHTINSSRRSKVKSWEAIFD
jgi:hypothetical protein